MRSGSSRDKRQQSRLLRGNSGGFEICTVNHLAGGTVRLDATIAYRDKTHEVGGSTFLHVNRPCDAFCVQTEPWP